MKHLTEFLRDNDCPLTDKQELLIIAWLKDVDLKSQELAIGMENHIKDKLFLNHEQRVRERDL